MNNEVGPVQIGLWKACADMPCTIGDDAIVTADGTAVDPAAAQCDRVTIFSETSTCRQGHCISGRSLVPGTSWDGNNLCDASAAASAFSVLSILLMVYFMWITLCQQLLSREPSFEGAAWVSFFAGLCSMACFAIWCKWLNGMNGEIGDLRQMVRFVACVILLLTHAALFVWVPSFIDASSS